MAIGSRRRRVVAAVVSLAVVVSVVVIGLVGVGGSSARPSVAGTPPGGDATVPTPTTVLTPATAPAAPSAADVAAARACEAFVVYLEDAQAGRVPAAVGRTLIADVAVLLRGAKKGQPAAKALPPWAGLASDLLAAANDVVSHKSAALKTDGAAAGAQCRSIPAAAARAGGFQRTG